MPFPECSEPEEEIRADGDFAGFAAFSIGDADNHAFAVDVFGADVDGFAESQPALVNNGKISAVSAITKRGNKEANLFASEDVWERFVAADFDLAPDFPTFAKVVFIERAQAVDSLI